jgi:hypothetical protein
MSRRSYEGQASTSGTGAEKELKPRNVLKSGHARDADL